MTVDPGLTPAQGAPGEPGRFAIDGPLPGPGITVIEASAGTGKTWTLTSLVVRFVAEGLDLSQILAVTFTRMATAQLRDRVRRRLRDAHRDVCARVAGAVTEDDALVDALCVGEPEVVALRVGRLAAALADFDAATIATTHGFCQMVLHGLGSAGDAAAEASVLEDPRDMVGQVADELYLRWCVGERGSHLASDPGGRTPVRPGDPGPPPGSFGDGTLPFDPPTARQAAATAVANPDTDLFPYSPGSRSGMLAELAGAVRDEVARRLAAGGISPMTRC